MMLYLLYLFTKTKNLEKNIATVDTWVYIVTDWEIQKQPYKIIEKNIKRLVTLARVYFVESLLYKYLWYLIIEYFVSLLYNNYNQFCRLIY